MASAWIASTRTRTSRLVYTLIGFTFVGLGLLGTVVPVMPTTVFLILAVWAFKRGNERFESWLLNHPRFGPTLTDWETNRSIKLRTKVIAIAMIWATIGVSIMIVSKLWVKLMLLGIATWLTWFLTTRKTAPAISGT